MYKNGSENHWTARLFEEGIVTPEMLPEMAESYGLAIERLSQYGVHAGMSHEAFRLIWQLDYSVSGLTILSQELSRG